MGRSVFKVPGGKLLRAKAEAENGVIKFIQVTGDFFMTPETDLEDLEAQLNGSQADSETVRKTIVGFFEARNTVITGASPDDFARVIIAALKG